MGRPALRSHGHHRSTGGLWRDGRQADSAFARNCRRITRTSIVFRRTTNRRARIVVPFLHRVLCSDCVLPDRPCTAVLATACDFNRSIVRNRVVLSYEPSGSAIVGRSEVPILLADDDHRECYPHFLCGAADRSYGATILYTSKLIWCDEHHGKRQNCNLKYPQT